MVYTKSLPFRLISSSIPDAKVLDFDLPPDLWTVEVRSFSGKSTRTFYDVQAGETLQLPGGAEVTLHAPYLRGRGNGPHRLWIATLSLPYALQEYLEEHGFPIRYSYVKEAWPSRYYQTVYATEKGSSEMPSAGRAFTAELITQLVAQGVQFAPLILHTGVASPEGHEPPYEEFYRVSPETARLVNAARAAGKRGGGGGGPEGSGPWELAQPRGGEPTR